jgi:uncharacterized protein YoxC
MADERHEIEVDVTGDADRKLDQIADSSEKASRGADKLEKKSNKLGVSMQALATGLTLVAAGLAKSIQLFAKQQAATGRLETAFKTAGASAKELAAAQALVNETQNKFGVSTVEGTDAIRRLIGASGDAETAMKDYALANDIASQESIELSRATEFLAKARKGEFEELKNLSGLSKEFTSQLTKLEDTTLATELAVEALTGQYEGAAEANAGLEEKTKSLTEETKNTAAAVGDAAMAILDMGLAIVGLGDTTKVLEDIQGAFKNLATEARVATSNIGLFIKGAGSVLLAGNARTKASELLRQKALTALEEGRFVDFLQTGIASGVAQGAGDTTGPSRTKIPNAPEQGFEFGVEEGMFVGGDGGGGGGGGGGRSRSTGPAVMAFDEADIQAFERQNAIMAKRNEIAREFDDTRRRTLEHELAILEIKDKQLEASEEEAEIAEATRSFLEDSRREQEATAQAIAEKGRAAREAVLAQKEEARAAKQRKGEEAARDEAQALKERNSAIRAGAQGLVAVADMAGASERQIAGLRGAMETAEAVAAAASGNVAGAIGHGVAAAQFFAIAGGAGGGGGGASAGTTTGSRGRGVARGAAAGASSGAFEGQRAGDTFVFQSTFPPTPEMRRRARESVQRDSRSSGGLGAR